MHTDTALTTTPQLLALRDCQSAWLQVGSGRLWLTEEGRADDRVLGAGEGLALQGAGRFWLSAFDRAAVLTLRVSGSGSDSPSASLRLRTAAPADAV